MRQRYQKDRSGQPELQTKMAPAGKGVGFPLSSTSSLCLGGRLPTCVAVIKGSNCSCEKKKNIPNWRVNLHHDWTIGSCPG